MRGELALERGELGARALGGDEKPRTAKDEQAERSELLWRKLPCACDRSAQQLMKPPSALSESRVHRTAHPVDGEFDRVADRHQTLRHVGPFCGEHSHHRLVSHG